MKFSEAMAALEQGKKVRCKSWAKQCCMFLGQAEENTHMGLLYWKDAYEDWELYEEPAKMLSFSEVVKGLKEGKKFRRKDGWILRKITSGYLMWGENEVFLTRFFPSIEDLEALDWIEAK